MNRNQDEAHLAVLNARQALRENRRSDARQWAERAASLAPHTEDPWLILAAIAGPRESLDHIQRALKINPESRRARRGMEWAMQRLRELPPEAAETRESPASRLPVPAAESAPVPASRPVPGARARPVVPILLAGIGVFVCAAAALSASMSPVVASIVKRAAPTHGPFWALVDIPKPTYTAGAPLAFDLQPTLIIESTPTPLEASGTDTGSPTEQPTEMATGEATQELPTAEPTWSGSLGMTWVDDSPTVAAPAVVPGDLVGGGKHWIDVNLSQQTVYAYAGDSVINSFLVSTGTWLHPTVTGQYHVYIKLRYSDMSGPDYYLPNVPYVMYFFRGYGLHGSYWHHNFGTPMSHGCVNLSIPDAEWLYNFSSVGTLVNVHY